MEACESRNQLILRNGAVTGFRRPLGLRNQAVVCRARDGRYVDFAPASEIGPMVDQCLSQAHKNLHSARSYEEIAESCAIFWMGFIGIHPFEDGNRRTAQSLLTEWLGGKGVTIPSYQLLEKYLMTGNVTEDLQKLKLIFLTSFRVERSNEEEK